MDEKLRLAGILADLREDGIVAQQENGDGYQIERKIPNENKRYVISLTNGGEEKLTLIEKVFSIETSSFECSRWIWLKTPVITQHHNNTISHVMNEFLQTQLLLMFEHLSSNNLSEKLIEDENNKMKSAEMEEKEAKSVEEKQILPVEAEEISEADLQIYQQWIESLLGKLNQSCGWSHGPIYEKQNDLRDKLLRHLIENRERFVGLDSNKEEKEANEESVEEDSDFITLKKLEQLALIEKYHKSINNHQLLVSLSDDLPILQAVSESLKKRFEEKKNEEKEADLNQAREGFFNFLEREKIPMIGKLSDHILQNGTGLVERVTKKLIRDHGSKVVKSWWDEYRSLEIEF